MNHVSLLFNIMMNTWSKPPPYNLRHSFHLPYININQGTYHLHSLEKIQCLKYNHQNYLEIVNTSKPYKMGEYTCVGLHCLVMNKPQQLKIYTNSIDETTILCLDQTGTQEVSLRLGIKPGKPGSIVSVNTTIYRAPRWISNALQPFLSFLLFYQPVECKHNQNLTLYRRMILGS